MWWQHAVYAVGLLGALGCMGLIDYRHKYAWFANRRRTLRTLLPAILFFTVWDSAGIVAKIFSDGDGKYRTGLELGPHFPIEEILFLALLTYTALIIWLSLATTVKTGKHD
ncbi:MAG: lycopene cyclase domain-containing protein [Patescibacteria group bacterium]|nr:lycopene cyclase domain-containing protein [Patescibacteria group bacterium]